MPNFKRPANRPLDVPSDPTIEYLLGNLGNTEPGYWNWLDRKVIMQSSNINLINGLQSNLNSNNINSSIHAAYLLFRLRINPDNMIIQLLSYLDRYPDNEALKYIFMFKFSSLDKEYLDHFRNSDIENSELINIAIREISL